MSYKKVKHSTYPYVTIVTVDRSEIERVDLGLCKQPAESPLEYYKRQTVKPDIVTNGGFFALSTGATCFGYRDEKSIISKAEYKGLGIIGANELYYGKDKDELRDFVSGYPVLISEGKKINLLYAQEINYNARRTAIGWNTNYLYIVTVDSPGLMFSALADIFMNLGVTYAINLDGGGSTVLYLDGKKETSNTYVRPVDNVFCVYLKKPVEEKSTVLYRVQLGAFLSKDNADKLKDEVVTYGFKDAYVKKIGLLYKVQVGAFSVKLNAERLRDRLKACGFSTYIITD